MKKLFSLSMVVFHLVNIYKVPIFLYILGQVGIMLKCWSCLETGITIFLLGSEGFFTELPIAKQVREVISRKLNATKTSVNTEVTILTETFQLDHEKNEIENISLQLMLYNCKHFSTECIRLVHVLLSRFYPDFILISS